MFRLSKMTDYGFVLLGEFARRPAEEALSARDLAEASKLPLPTVSKLLKILSGSGLLQSQRGAQGGYRLSRAPAEINALQIMGALEGPVAITDCTQSSNECVLGSDCTARPHWMQINHTLRRALTDMTLEQLSRRPHSTPSEKKPSGLIALRSVPSGASR